eukprot:1243812-Rhodomonas_salina.2
MDFSYLQLQHCNVSANVAAAHGGGVWLGGSSDVVALSSTVGGNRAYNGDGGGVAAVAFSSVTLDGETAVSGNEALEGRGGGVFANGFEVVLKGVTEISDNSAMQGGGLYVLCYTVMDTGDARPCMCDARPYMCDARPYMCDARPYMCDAHTTCGVHPDAVCIDLSSRCRTLPRTAEHYWSTRATRIPGTDARCGTARYHTGQLAFPAVPVLKRALCSYRRRHARDRKPGGERAGGGVICSRGRGAGGCQLRAPLGT